MKKSNALIKYVLPVLFLNLIIIKADGQRLPNMQKSSIRAPANIKIDGKVTEWNNLFQAHNRATNIFYTIANDDDKLYLVLQARDPDIIVKTILQGVTLTINNSGSAKDKNNIAIRFPVYDKKDPPFYVMLDNRPQLLKDIAKYRMQTDSFMNVRNSQINEKLKLIGVMGVKKIADSIISIYNDDGIKAAALFDNKLYYNYELAIPLKYLEDIINKSVTFHYNIKLNGAGTGKGNGNVQSVETSRGNILQYTASNGVTYGIGLATPQNMILAYPTDFWGEYTLAKK